MRKEHGYDNYRLDDYTVIGRITLPEEHLVEDARTPREGKKQKTEDRKTRSPVIKTLLTVAITILCFSLTLIAADIFSGKASIANYAALFYKKKENGTCYYAVYATLSEDMAISYKNASAIRKEGGAGYVLKESGSYYVILNIYELSEDAENVKKRNANYDVLQIFIPDFNLKKTPSLSAAETSKDIFTEAYRTLYQAANDLAGGNYKEEDMKRQLVDFREKILAVENSFEASIRGKEDTATIEYKVLLAEVRSAFENLTEHSSSLVSDARYYSVMILHSYSIFAKKYFS